MGAIRAAGSAGQGPRGVLRAWQPPIPPLILRPMARGGVASALGGSTAGPVANPSPAAVVELAHPVGEAALGGRRRGPRFGGLVLARSPEEIGESAVRLE